MLGTSEKSSASRSGPAQKALSSSYKLSSSSQQLGLLQEAVYAWQASRDGDLQGLLDLFSEDIEFHSDGGGMVPAALNVLKGPWRTARFLTGLARKFPHEVVEMPRLRRINGAPGWVMRDGNGVLQTTAFEIRNGRIAKRPLTVHREPGLWAAA